MRRTVFALGLSIALLSVAELAESSSLFAADSPVKLKLVRSSDKGVESSAGTIYGLALSPDGKHVLVGGDEASTLMVLWNIETGENDQFFDIFLPEVDGSPYAPALSPDGKTAAVCTTLGKLFFIDLATGNVLKKLDLPILSTTIRFSPDSRQLAFVDLNGRFSVVDCNDHKISEAKAKSHDGPGIAVAWSGDGKRIVTTSADKSARIWEAATLTELLKLPHDEWVWSVACSADSTRIATGTGGPLEGHPLQQSYAFSDNNVIRIWNAADGKLVRELKGHTERIHCLAFTPDGKRLISGSFDKTLRVWDVATGTELARAEGEGWVFCVDVAADSKTVVAGGGSHKIGGAWKQFPQERLRVFRIEE